MILNNDSTLNVDPQLTAFNDTSSLLTALIPVTNRSQSSAIVNSTSTPLEPSDPNTFFTPTALTDDTSIAIDALRLFSGTQDSGFSLVNYADTNQSAIADSSLSTDPTAPIVTAVLDLSVEQPNNNLSITINDPNQVDSGGFDISNEESDGSIVLAGAVKDPNGTNRVQPVDPINPTLPDPQDQFNRALDAAQQQKADNSDLSISSSDSTVPIITTALDPNSSTGATTIDDSTQSGDDTGDSIVLASSTSGVDRPSLDPNTGGNGGGNSGGGNNGGGTSPEDDFNKAIEKAKQGTKTSALDPGTDETDLTQTTGSIDRQTTNSDPTQSTGSTDSDISNVGNGDSGDTITTAGGAVNDPNGTNRVQPIDPVTPDPNGGNKGGGSGDSPFQQLMDQIKKKMADASSFDERYAITSQINPIYQPPTLNAAFFEGLYSSIEQQAQSLIPEGSDSTVNDFSRYGLHPRLNDSGTYIVEMSYGLYNDNYFLGYRFAFADQSGNVFSLQSVLSLDYYDETFSPAYDPLSPSQQHSFSLGAYESSVGNDYHYQNDVLVGSYEYSGFSSYNYSHFSYDYSSSSAFASDNFRTHLQNLGVSASS